LFSSLLAAGGGSMAHQLDQFKAQRDAVLGDTAGKLPAGRRDVLLTQAILQRYSKDRPRELATDIAGNGTSLLALPSSGGDTFEVGFSSVRQIEFPIGSVPPDILLDEDWRLYRDPATLKIMILSTTPSASDSLRVTWTARHNKDGSTVPDADFEAVCDYSVALCYAALAELYTQTGDPSMQADVVNYRSKNQEYLSLAKAAEKRYFNHLGIEPSADGAETGAAIAAGSLHETMGWGGDRLTHPRSNR
jgi:hypothetical protein